MFLYASVCFPSQQKIQIDYGVEHSRTNSRGNTQNTQTQVPVVRTDPGGKIPLITITYPGYLQNKNKTKTKQNKTEKKDKEKPPLLITRIE